MLRLVYDSCVFEIFLYLHDMIHIFLFVAIILINLVYFRILTYFCEISLYSHELRVLC